MKEYKFIATHNDGTVVKSGLANRNAIEVSADFYQRRNPDAQVEVVIAREYSSSLPLWPSIPRGWWREFFGPCFWNTPTNPYQKIYPGEWNWT
jgi:hypothetical protein